ncbi:hypothetical protein TNCV_3366731 [Trichonephila clavipes]|nr:hypothetical protein TNCV_3366731 [Trichonephila clavipes]
MRLGPPWIEIQQQVHEQAGDPLSAYVVERLMSSNDPVLMSMLCIKLDQPSWRQYHLFGIDSLTGKKLSDHL